MVKTSRQACQKGKFGINNLVNGRASLHERRNGRFVTNFINIMHQFITPFRKQHLFYVLLQQKSQTCNILLKPLPKMPMMRNNTRLICCRCSSGVEQRIRNAWVGGSNPFNGTIIYPPRCSEMFFKKLSCFPDESSHFLFKNYESQKFHCRFFIHCEFSN